MKQSIKIQLISVLVVGMIIGLGVYPFIFPAYDELGPAMGTGFFVSDDGCIVTNAHVVEYSEIMGNNKVLIRLPIDIPEERGGDDIKYHSDHMYYKYGEILKIGWADGGDWDGGGIIDDLALIKIYDDSPIFFLDEDGIEVETNLAFSPVPVTINTNTPQGEDGALAIGHPGIQSVHLGYWIPTVGWFAEINRNTNEYIFEVPTFTGNSGGPVLNLDGELVGVVWGGASYEVFEDEEGEEVAWGFPYNNMHLNEIYQTEIIDWSNLGWFLFDTGATDTFAERSTTVIEFLEGTPCNIKTSTSTPMRFSEEEYDKELEQLAKIFEEAKYKVVSVEEI